MNTSRRLFLKSAAALAVAAVIPGTFTRVLADDYQRLLAAMRTGVIRNQTFLFHEPITIDFDNLLIYGCRFIFRCKAPIIGAVITINAKNSHMESCYIDCGPMGADYGVSRRILHGQFTIAGVD